MAYLNCQFIVGNIKVYFHFAIIKIYSLIVRIVPIDVEKLQCNKVFQKCGYRVNKKYAQDAVIYKVVFAVGFLFGEG